jgi:hypothetical protein
MFPTATIFAALSLTVISTAARSRRRLSLCESTLFRGAKGKCVACFFFFSALVAAQHGFGDAATERAAAIRGTLGTYAGEPRTKDGRVDIDRLIQELVDLKANTYHWLIWHASTDWEDLHTFLPAARQNGIKVWVSLVPPSESPPNTKNYSEPFRLDYLRWAQEIARLSVREPNLVAWSIDDYTHNLRFFTPEKMRDILDAAHKINPTLAFVPCSYFPAVTQRFAEDYQGLFDGLLFPYRHESSGANLTDASLVEEEVAQIRRRIGPGVPVLVDIYATGHSRLGQSTPDYVEQAMMSARKAADGVLIYCHQNPKTEKYQVIKRLFQQWAK